MAAGAHGNNFSRAQINWLLYFGAVSCAVHFCLSVIMTISGPSQPYIARNVGSDPATVSLQWSVRGAGWMAGSIASSAVFKKYIRSPRMKVSEVKKRVVVVVVVAFVVVVYLSW